MPQLNDGALPHYVGAIDTNVVQAGLRLKGPDSLSGGRATLSRVARGRFTA